MTAFPSLYFAFVFLLIAEFEQLFIFEQGTILGTR